MVNLIKRLGSLCFAVIAATPAMAFSLLGPVGNGGDGYQTPILSYGLSTDYGAPKNLGEEFRLNIPEVYYSFDASFLDYFGQDGVRAVDAAFELFNNLTNVSSYSTELFEFPMDSQRLNYRAQALQLLDVKSMMLCMIAERVGLAQPGRWTWSLRRRDPCPNGGCGPPVCFLYEVIMRNFDPVTWLPTRYVNGTRYTYFVTDFCPADQHDAIEVVVDPLTVEFNAVADFWYGLEYGGFYSTMTRDDVGGLRYLWRTNNMNVENLGVGVVGALTNLNQNQLLVTSNLALLVAQSFTNDAGALAALYPGLVVANTTSFFTNVVTTNAVAYFTNYPWSPAGGPGTLVFSTNYTTNVATWYSHSFANLRTNSYFTNGIIRIRTTTVGPCLYGPPGLVCTNINWRITATNAIVGDYYLLPTNSQCGVSIVSTQFVTTLTITNDILAATNTFSSTNVGSTNVVVQQFSQTEFSYFTNHFYIIHPVTCVSNGTALMQGVEKVRFIRRDYDSLLGRFFYPVTSTYTNRMVTNNTVVPVPTVRSITAPDILIAAVDLDTLSVNRAVAPFDEAQVLSGLAGPGTIVMPNTFQFNKVGPMYFNTTYFADEATATGTNFVWASFDSSTNDPVIYPQSRTIMELENLVLIQVLPASLPVGTNGVPYPPTSLGGQGGQQPYTWRLSPGSGGLPPGLSGLTMADQPVATITGTPTQTGTFDFTIRMTDVNGRFVDVPYYIRIEP